MPEFSQLGLAAATEPLFVANWLLQRTFYDWRIVSLDGSPVRASNGRAIAVDGDIGAAADAKTVFVLASFEPARAAGERKVLRWLKRLARFGVELGGIENGSLVLAAAGLLDGHTVAVHWDNLSGLQQHHPTCRAVAQLYARSGARVTCAGAAAILDMMVAWMGWHGEGALAREVAEHLLMAGVRAGATEQRGAAGTSAAAADPVVERAHVLMRAHLEEPLACNVLARRLGVSLRQLERRFKQQARCSVLAAYRAIRMANAHRLLQQTSLSVTEVALACGYASPEHFSRLYRTMFDRPPSRDREQSTRAPVLRRR